LPLVYAGFARDTDNRMVAFLETTGSAAGHFNLRESDYLIGRYRVNKITPQTIEIEDIERAESAPDRKRTISISPQIAGRP
jgi:hypothetical protein